MSQTDITKKYQRLDPIEHALKRPGMYIGGIEEITDNIWILENGKIIEKNIAYSPGLYKIFDEIIVNAYDQTIRDDSVETIRVEINEDKNEISVFNDGRGIDVVMHPKEKMYVPELIFGHLRTSTTFDDSNVRITGGIHGLGAKLTAIYSKYFKVEIGDPKNKKSFSQIYTNNLSTKSKPIVKDYTGDKGYVKITFRPDLKYFSIKDKMQKDFIGLLKRRVYDIAGLTKKNVVIFLDGEKLPVKDFNNYVNLFDKDVQIQENCDITDENFKEGRWRIVIVPSYKDATNPDEGIFKQMSFVNGIYTSHGGKHVEYIMNRITKKLKEYIAKKYKTDKIKTQFIRDQFWIFLAAVIENPTFSSQTKEEMITPVDKFGSACSISDTLIKKIFSKTDINLRINQRLNFIRSTDLSKLDSKRKKTLKGIPKLYDANLAGTKKSNECTLVLTEGDSAKAMAISGLSVIPKSNNIYGVFPLKGKLLNVREASHSKIMNNSEFVNLKKILGLQTNKVYTEDNLSELRYGAVLLMMDADVDGSHIKGLFINLLHTYWPSLLKIDGFLKVFITPVVKITRKSSKKDPDPLSFYSLDDYDKWKLVTKNKDRFDVKYYKGLGTNTPAEAKEYFSDLGKHIIDFKWVESSDDSIKLAFEKKRANDRKVWLSTYDKANVFDYSATTISYKDFINKELIHFSNYDNVRSLPSIIDGLKPSQRKVLYACFKRNLISDIKVAQLVGYVSEHTSYHHGEASLSKTIIGMAQTFIGANNINLLKPKGQFGTRLLAGQDHSSPRYIYTQLEETTRLIFHKDDDALLNYLDDDGFTIEPEYYIPIIPMVLINGSTGIGTGYSTYIPKFNPMDIIDSLVNRLSGDKFKSIDPWYRNYTGKIQKMEKLLYITKGTYAINEASSNKLSITELPITSWTEPYKNFLEAMIEDKKHKNVLNNSNESEIDFTIMAYENDIFKNLETIKSNKFVNALEKEFQLVRMINLGNMTAYDKNVKIKKYTSITQILNEFFDVRLDFYDKRKKYLLKKLKSEIDILKSKVKFINLVISKKIKLFNKKKDEIINILEKQKDLIKLPNETPYDYLIRMSFYSLTKEKIDELTNLLKTKQKLYDALNKKKIENIWLDDLMNLKNGLIKIYGE
jgi:DNA topoisomerase-2